MEKPQDYNLAHNTPYKEWKQEWKDYKNWKRRCFMKPEWIDLTDEERYIEKNKNWQISRNAWKIKKESLTEEELKIINQKKGSHYHNLSEEDKIKHNKILQQRSKDFWNSLTPIERSEFGKYRWNLKSDEEKMIISKRFNQAGVNRMKLLSREEIMKQIKYMNKKWKEKFDNDETFRNKQIKLLRKHNQEFWNNITNLEYWNNEIEFLDDLLGLCILYTHPYMNQIKHKDFDKLFPNNPITGSPSVEYQHLWDFKLNLKQKSILVDIDGSIHYNESYKRYSPYIDKEYSMLDYIKFNDSKRSYQTDGLDAYIIQCYDDKLTNDTKVLHLQTNKEMSYKDFINEIKFLNYSKKEIRKIIKEGL